MWQRGSCAHGHFLHMQLTGGNAMLLDLMRTDTLVCLGGGSRYH